MSRTACSRSFALGRGSVALTIFFCVLLGGRNLTFAQDRRNAQTPDTVVTELAHEVEGIRGLSFRTIPRVRVESSESLAGYFRERLVGLRGRLCFQGRLAHAMGALPDDTDLLVALVRLNDQRPNGYYDSTDRVLVLTDTEATNLNVNDVSGLEARAHVVRALVHALHYQHFGRSSEPVSLRGLPLGDAERARIALFEGDASEVARQWSERARGSVIVAPSRAAQSRDALVPDDLTTTLQRTEQIGAQTVRALVAAGGWARVNAALLHDPPTTAELMHPTRGELGAPTSRTSFYAERTDSRPERVLTVTLGELGLRGALEHSLETGAAATLARTWRADTATLSHTELGDGLVWTVRCGDVEGAQAVERALAPWMRQLRAQGRVEVGTSRQGAVVTVQLGHRASGFPREITEVEYTGDITIRL